MAWTYTQDFDSLSTADLNGQDSWVSDATRFNVQTGVILQGSKSVSCTPGGSNRDASRTISAVTDGGVSFLYRTTNATEGNGIFTLSGAGGTACTIVWEAGTLKGYNGATYTTLASYSANTTYKLAFVFNCSTDKYDIYLDDVKVADQFSFRNNQTSITSFNISSQAGSLDTIYFDDIRAYPTASTLTDNLVSYWKFNESSGNASDSVGINTLTNTNSVSFVTGKIGNGVDFESSSSQYFKIDDGTQSGLDITGNMTILGWYKPESLPSSAYVMTPLVSKWVSTGNQRAYRFGISQDASNVTSLGFNHSGNGSTSTNNYVNYSFSTGTWYLIGMVYDASAGSVEFFVNGSSIGTVSSLATSTFNSSAQFEIGGNAQQSEYADGVADEVGVWARKLTSTEISSIYNSGNGLSYPFASSVTFTVEDTASTTDSFLSTLDAKLSDTISLIESILFSRGVPFTVEDYVTAIDTIKLDMGLTVQDIVSMSDEQLFRLLWETISRTTNTTWSSANRTSSTNWTSITRQ